MPRRETAAPLRVSLDELGVRQRTLSRELEQFRHRVEPEDLPHERCERERQRSRSGADVEGPLVAARPDEVANFLRELRRTAILAGRDALGRTREAV